MKTITKPVLLFSLLAGVAAPIATVTAETVAMPSASNSDVRKVSMPERGMSKQQVEAMFGEPDSRHGPTGKPAIYYWEYADFTVYFEANFVIHAVSKHK
ncbi:hypothetical protein [Saccharophagus degradans]|uniref:Lipoprotein SmpA/OmlA domain-containing protein n=1 Tax=Saccharophagus degradans (strain 2-40 / ATCC 43961 / DSM 17024) TaxID=203122 RepID=Q21JR2_SACD2|nr:hypothetical protein [Saccharophagus degradans]ABD81067.1 conserved hypothetical protein [Saccharophagus degradans 2-40]